MAAEPIDRQRRARSTDRRRAALDGVRGLAVVAYVAGHLHVPGLAGGWIGLELLLVTSGFSVTNWLLDRTAGEPLVRRYLLRRIARVLPVVVAVVLFALVWSYVQDGEFTSSVRGAALAAVAQVYGVARVVGAVDGRAFTTLWAVGLEFQFSLVALVLVGVLGRRPARRAAAITVVLAFVAMMSRLAMVGAGGAPGDVMVLPWFHADGLLLGAAVAFAHRRVAVDERQRLYRWTLPALGLLAATVVVIPAWSSWSVPSVVAVVPLVSIVGAVVVMAVVTRSAPATVTRALAWPGLRGIGGRSLGLYVWCHPIAVMLVGGGVDGWQGYGMLLRQVALTIVVVMASYEFVEGPVRALLLRLDPPPHRP